MNSLTLPSAPQFSPAPVETGSVCPFHDGLATLDLLLAALDPRETSLFDAVLDLRSLATGGDASACLAQLFKVRALLDGRHYLAFYRVRCWAQRAFRIEVRTRRGEAALVRSLPRDCARIDEIVNSSLAELAQNGEIPPGAYVRFLFANSIQ